MNRWQKIYVDARCGGIVPVDGDDKVKYDKLGQLRDFIREYSRPAGKYSIRVVSDYRIVGGNNDMKNGIMNVLYLIDHLDEWKNDGFAFGTYWEKDREFV